MAVSERWRGYGVAFWFAVGWLGLIVLGAVTASWLPLHPTEIHPLDPLAGPSWSHLMGTTGSGEDIFAIVVHGTRVALVVGVSSALVGLTFGAILGVLAGYFRGWVDTVVSIVVDSIIAFPALVLASAVVVYAGQNLRTITITIGLLTMPLVARVVRTATLAIADREFMLAGRMLGARHGRLIWRDLAPNIAVPVLAYGLLIVGVAILVEGALSFFSLGAPLGMASWGRLVAEGNAHLQQAPQVSLFPAGVFFLTILSLNFVGDRVQTRWLLGAPLPKVQPAARLHRLRRAAGAMQPDESAPLLEVRSLKTYLATPFGPVRAVDGVSLSVERGRLLAVVGESGSGKTMLARSILGLIPDRMLAEGTAGEILLEGVDLRGLSDEELRRRRGHEIAMVFQDPMTSLDPVMRVGRQIGEPARVHLGLSRSEANALAVSLLDQVGVADPERRVRQYPHELSGGLRQRVAIALALSCGPKLLIADEPTSALDVTVQAQILDLLDDLRRERNMAVILITHDLGVVAGRADEVAVMYAGRIVEQAPTDDLFARMRMPYTEALLEAAPRLAAQPHSRLRVIEGSPPNLLIAGPGCAFAPRCRYARERCQVEMPALVGNGHRYACWFPRQTDAHSLTNDRRF